MCRLCYRTDTWQEPCKVSFRCPKMHQVNTDGKCSFVTATAALDASPTCLSATIYTVIIAVGFFFQGVERRPLPALFVGQHCSAVQCQCEGSIQG